MATYSLVHGAWHGGWAWDLVAAELETRGHGVHAPDLPCEEVGLTAEDDAAVVPPADVVVGQHVHLANRLRRQAPLVMRGRPSGGIDVVAARDARIRPPAIVADVLESAV